MAEGPGKRAHRRAGTMIRDKYRIDAFIATGSMANVYAATHRNGSRVALKVLHRELARDPSMAERFRREGYFANAIGHPGVVRAIDDDLAEDGCAFIVMELLEGENLEERRQRLGGRVPLAEALQIADAMLDVLSAAHGHEVLHRDLKPENVFITRKNEVKLLDFGVARFNDGRSSSDMTGVGMVLGTPAFMPPEQALGRREDVDVRSDIWAVGATLFTVIAGQSVHVGGDAKTKLIATARTPARPIREVAPETPRAVASVIDRALAFDKAERWADADAMREALRWARMSLDGETSSQLERLNHDAVAPPVPTRRTPEDEPTLAGRSIAGLRVRGQHREATAVQGTAAERRRVHERGSGHAARSPPVDGDERGADVLAPERSRLLSPSVAGAGADHRADAAALRRGAASDVAGEPIDAGRGGALPSRAGGHGARVRRRQLRRPHAPSLQSSRRDGRVEERRAPARRGRSAGDDAACALGSTGISHPCSPDDVSVDADGAGDRLTPTPRGERGRAHDVRPAQLRRPGRGWQRGAFGSAADARNDGVGPARVRTAGHASVEVRSAPPPKLATTAPNRRSRPRRPAGAPRNVSVRPSIAPESPGPLLATIVPRRSGGIIRVLVPIAIGVLAGVVTYVLAVRHREANASRPSAATATVTATVTMTAEPSAVTSAKPAGSTTATPDAPAAPSPSATASSAAATSAPPKKARPRRRSRAARRRPTRRRASRRRLLRRRRMTRCRRPTERQRHLKKRIASTKEAIPHAAQRPILPPTSENGAPSIITARRASFSAVSGM